MQILSVVSIILFFTGIIFKTMHWPGAGVLMLTGVSIGVLFLIFLLVSGLTGLNNGKEKASIVIGAIAMIFVLIGFAFKIMHWPGAGVMIIIAHIGLFISSVVMFIDALSEKESSKQSIKMIFSFTIFILMCILLFFAFYTNAIVIPVF